MDKKLMKMYIIILLSYMIAIIFIPELFGYSSLDIDLKTDLKTMLNQSMRDSCETIPDQDKCSVVFIFDDGWDTQYTQAYGLFKKHGKKANIAVIPRYVGAKEYMSLNQLSELYLNGWDLLNHTYDHQNLSSVSLNEQEKQMTTGRDWLSGHYFKSGKNIVIFPGGFYNQTTLDVLMKDGFKMARGLDSVWLISSSQAKAVENVVFLNMNNQITVESAESVLEDAVSQKKSVIVILHKIQDKSDFYRMNLSSEKLEQILKYICENDDRFEILTMSEFYGKQF